MINESRLAWTVELEGVVSIAFAATSGKARWQAVKAWRAAGYGADGKWPATTVMRAAEFDESPLRNMNQRCWAVDIACRGTEYCKGLQP